MKVSVADHRRHPGRETSTSASEGSGAEAPATETDAALDPRDELLEALVADLRAVRPAPSWASAVFGWALASGVFAALAILATGPLRPSLASELSALRLPLELGLGLASVIALIAAGLEVGVPGGPAATRLLTPAAILMTGWLLLMLFGEALPGAAPSMLDKRAHCLVEGLAIALPPTLLALRQLRQRMLFAPALAGALVGAAAASLAALGMQVACLYESSHALRFHAAPILIVAIAAAATLRLTGTAASRGA